jgi:hypothetical protein
MNNNTNTTPNKKSYKPKTKFGELSWDDKAPLAGEALASTKLPFLKLQEGNTKIRLLTKAHVKLIHKVKPASSTNPKDMGKTVNCSVTPDCPACVAGIKQDQKYMFNCIQRGKEDTLCLADFGYQIFKRIKELAQSEDWGDPTKYDLTINKNPKTLGWYSVQPNPHKPLSGAAADLAKSATLDSLTFWETPLSVEKVKESMDAILNGAAPFVGDDEYRNEKPAKEEVVIPQQVSLLDADDSEFLNV